MLPTSSPAGERPAARLFVSYAHHDREAITPLTAGLEDAGYEVWWDDRLEGGDRFRDEIETRLTAADIIIVVWSKNARASRWVLDEAERGVQRGVLLPIRIDGTTLPLGFGGFQVLDFGRWNGDYQSDIWRRFLRRIDRITPVSAATARRSARRLLSHAAIVTAMWGTALGALLWALYSTATPDSMLGHPLLDAIVLGCVAALPVVLWATVEVRRAGFRPLRLLIRRSARWFLLGALPAVLIVVLAMASGVVAGLTSRAALLQIARVFAITAMASAAVVTSFNLARWKLRAALAPADD